jgi:hypothetical protein
LVEYGKGSGMSGNTGMLRGKLAAIVAAQAAADRAVVEFLELARECEAGDHTEAESGV